MKWLSLNISPQYKSHIKGTEKKLLYTKSPQNRDLWGFCIHIDIYLKKRQIYSNSLLKIYNFNCYATIAAMDTLGKLFGSNAIVKILRLFLFNPTTIFEISEIVRRTKVPSDTVRIEINMMQRIGLIKKKTFYKETEKKRGKSIVKVVTKKRVQGCMLDETFELLEPLQKFFLETAVIKPNELIRNLRKAGNLHVVIVAGSFLQDWDGRVDLLVVGNNLKKGRLETIIRDVEAEMGMELKYAAFTTEDFKYRLGIRDKLLRDILDFPHQKLVNRLNLL